MPKDAPPNGGAPAGDGPDGSASAGIGDADQASPLGGGRSRPQVRRPVQLRARPGDADGGVRPGRGQHRVPDPPAWTACTVADVEEQIGVPGFLDDLRAQLKTGTFRPLPVRERKIPKPGGSGKVRRLGIPTVADRVVQAALKLVLEPIFEADFVPVSYGFRPHAAGTRRDRRDPPASAPRAIGGCWTRISRRVSTRSTTRP